MDDRRFDDLSRRLATGVSRRQVLKALAGGVLGGLAGSLGITRAAACAADRDCPPGQRCDTATATCVPRGGGPPANQSQSQSIGIAATCAADSDCAPNEACVDGVCAPRGGACTLGSACVSDATCCGGEVCDTGSGACVGAGGPCTNTTGICIDSTDCCGNEECVGGTCQRTAGGCAPGPMCASDVECCGGQVCAGGTCVQAARPAGCPEGQVRCSGTCVDILSDPNNCGACGVICESGFCTSGRCGYTGSCPEGQEVCVDFSTGEGPGCCGICEVCRAGDGMVFCRPKCSDCAPCNPVTGECEPIIECGPCEYCGGLDANGQPFCVSACGACGVCDQNEFGEQVCVPSMDCGPCAWAIDDQNGNCTCEEFCDPCSTCDPVLGCVSSCPPDKVCNYGDTTCVCDLCSIYDATTDTCSSACAPGEVCHWWSNEQGFLCCPEGYGIDPASGECVPSF